MRVLHVIDSLDPKMGGLPLAALSLACAQSLAGAEVGILYYRALDPAPPLDPHFRELPGLGSLTLCSLPAPSGMERLFAHRARAAIRDFAPDVLHTHGCWEPVLRHAHATANSMGIPRAFTPHSMLHPWQNQNRRLAKFLLCNVLDWERLWKSAAVVHALSPEEEGVLRERGFPRLVCVPNGVFPPGDEESESDPPPPWLEALGDRPMILFLARLDPVKRPDLLLEAFVRLASIDPKPMLVLAGPDYGLKPQLAARAKGAGLADRVLFPGMLGPRDKAAAWKRAHGFCLPSQSEGCSMAVLEAAVRGVPILITEACDLRHWVTAGAAAALGEEPESIASTLFNLLHNPEHLHQMGQSARQRVTRDYLWDGIARKLLAAYALSLSSGTTPQASEPTVDM